jgi:hypothetical protein
MSWLEPPSLRLLCDPKAIAHALYEAATAQPEARDSPIPEAIRAKYQAKRALYRQANNLLALISRVKPSTELTFQDPLFLDVLHEYEAILGSKGDFAAVMKAMIDLASRWEPDEETLATVPEENREIVWAMRWSKKWLDEVDYSFVGPDSLIEHFTFWSQHYVNTQHMLDRMIMRPVSGVLGVVGRLIGRGWSNEFLKQNELEDHTVPSS